MAYHRPPSEQLGIADPLAALVINQACLWAGTHHPKPDQPPLIPGKR